MMENVRRLERKRGVGRSSIRSDFCQASRIFSRPCLSKPRYRSDILIVLNNSAPVLIPTAEDFYARTTALKDSLLETRTKYALESNRYQRSLCFVLQELYELVGRDWSSGDRKPAQTRDH